MSMRHTTDVVIIGGGVVGCTIAYHLRKKGVEVIVMEREEIAAESSSAAAGLLSPLGRLLVPGAGTELLLASWSRYDELLPALEEASGVHVEYQQHGSLRTATSEQEEAQLRQQMVFWASLGIEVVWLTGDEARQREPLLGPEVVAAVHAPKEGSIKAPALTRAYAGAARYLGALIYEQTEVAGIQSTGSRITGVQTVQDDTIICNHLVIAAGAWSARCSDWLGFSLPVSPMRGQILSLRQPAQPMRHILFDGNIYLIPKFDNTIYAGATVERVGFDKQITAGGVAWLLSSTLALAPALANTSIANIWAGLRPGSPDDQPILGKAPGWENVTLATGHGGAGFELSAITGQTIAELVSSGQTPELIRPFGLERFTTNI
ncbi:MAG TPA: glycine oxidase ThiO [Ktedonosporobacter sp.]|nr:glycine oxidase ThiO [Ktedonosporobacter sp.]